MESLEIVGGLRELALFAGAGGGILGGKLSGWRTVCAVEIDPYARKVLLARQRDRILEPFPIWDDIRTFDGRPWIGNVDVVSGGFPCQDISIAGKGAGIDGERSGLWREMARVIGEVRPRFVFVENSPHLVRRGLARILGDLAAMGYDARWGVAGAHHVGAPHRRDRIWIVGWQMPHSDGLREPQPQGAEQEQRRRSINLGEEVSDTTSVYAQGQPPRPREEESWGGDWWATEPSVGRVADGVACRVDRLKAIGNGQVPSVVALAWNLLKGGA